MVNLSNVDQQQTKILFDAYLHDKIAHAYLFIDPTGYTALATAYWLICLLNCTGEHKPDANCNNCQRILNGNHPDVFLVEAENKKSLSIDQIRPLKEELAKKPVEGSRRFFIVKDASLLTLSANNALLNLLEEPVAPVVTILIANNENTILPTVRSRTQIIHFAPTKQKSSVTEDLLTYGLNEDEIADMGDVSNLEQEITYLYQELCQQNELSIVRAYKISKLAAKSNLQKFVFYKLAKIAMEKIEKNKDYLFAPKLLQLLMECDKMRTNNVSFYNCLNYIVLSFN
ncbi:DNA polymerase III subunit delta [Lactobacillus iners]|jgi:DNA-directed DNA polymerase III delta' subunit|uniref:DNA polymerase III, delta' subunit n=1 Tax=Lactobacillus iners DSM 13335 TaxID=525328 RepID=C8PCQ0_9LACO|nr:DNA polymerase III subunit delta [Lactobacillus iners]EEW51708.1 hypothetical protein HMPREF0520_0870 [Lactobacillus iners DSM 13335]EFU79113.1 hypothetical protein HMPREF9223_0076 [Lactobacillus iners ATCC 55195]KRL59732.1 DNA-directed DNA polymerase III delta subunit [Lactobacillus iners DSM 13335]MBW8450592.1 DNA polymerase III subunit delta [Lactobacillus iners]MCT7669953.1 DNA polymerase III subunit delta [Lactobacillus iners]